MKNNYFISLDGIRGIAALVVVWLHCNRLTGVTMVPKGYLAVDLFFVLSGVVIANAYENKLRAGMSIGRLAVIRFIRLYPLYFFGSIIGGMAIGLADISKLKIIDVIFAIIVLPGYREPNLPAFPLNNPAWSLFFEFWINMFYGLAIFLLSLRNIAILMALSLPGIIAIALFSSGRNLDVGWTFASLPHGAFRITFPFFAGVLLYRVYQARKPIGLVRSHSTIFTLALLVAITLVLMAPLHTTHIFSSLYDILCVTILFPIIVYISMQTAPTGYLARICIVLGIISYPAYCLHAPMMMGLRLNLESGQNITLMGAAIFVCAIALISYVVNYIYDAPVRRWLGAVLLPNQRPKSNRDMPVSAERVGSSD